MVLTLEVVGEQAENLGAAGRKVFDSIGGTIGRLPDNDWVFPDPYVSGRHALIRYVNGKYFIEDTSTNGVFINSPDKRVPRTESQLLKHGDVIFIDAYRIRVSIEDGGESARRDDPLASFRQAAEALRAGKKPAREADRATSRADKAPEDDQGTQWFAVSDALQQEAAASAAVSQPPETDRSRGEAAPAGAGAADRFLETLLAAAGIDGLDPSEETAQVLGEALRAAGAGVIDALQARERAKAELRMRRSGLKPIDNNPLKLSQDARDAFQKLFVKRNPAHLAPPAAFQDALRDLREHQEASLAAIRTAYAATVAKLDPERLQEEFDRQMTKGSILGVPPKLRYWDLYRDMYAGFAKDPESTFRTLFADEFAKAYEEQLERFRAQRPDT